MRACVHDTNNLVCRSSDSFICRQELNKAQRSVLTHIRASGSRRSDAAQCKRRTLSGACTEPCNFTTRATFAAASNNSCRRSSSICKATQAPEDSHKSLSPVAQNEQQQGSEAVDAFCIFQTMRDRLNFKYPRARKMLLMFWSMALLRASQKGELPIADIYHRFNTVDTLLLTTSQQSSAVGCLLICIGSLAHAAGLCSALQYDSCCCSRCLM